MSKPALVINGRTYVIEADLEDENGNVHLGVSSLDTIKNIEESWRIKFVSDKQWCKENNCTPEEFKKIWGWYPGEYDNQLLI